MNGFNAGIIAPRFRSDPQWRWLMQIGPMRQCRFTSIYIQNTFERFPKLSKPYCIWQYHLAANAVREEDVVFLFSDAIVNGVTKRLPRDRPKCIYANFTQDDAWNERRIARARKFFRHCDAVTVLSEDERQSYLPRYHLDPEKVHLIPIHTDETDGYGKYPDVSPLRHSYALALGSPNRLFKPTAVICRELNIPLVIITRPTHKNDSLDELSELGATIITDADKMKSLTYLKHAKLAVMPFKDPGIPGGYTTIIHAMFMRTPFVATRCLGISDYVIDGETGLIAPHGDELALQKAIARVWHEPGLATTFGDAALKRAQERHSLEAAARRFFDVASNLLASGR